MKKYFKLFFIALCAAVVTAAPASAETFFASDVTGAVMEDKIVTVNEKEAEVVYEWFAEACGMYRVSFNDAISSGCNITATINGGYAFRIADVTKQLTMGFDSGINKIALKIKKTSDAATFSVGTVKFECIEAIDADTIHIEANEDSYTYVTSGHIYYENYGTDMSAGDVMLMQKSTVPEIEFLVYAPVSGEYSMTAQISHLGQGFTSDINMMVNGMSYPLTADTMTRLADLTNASDRGLMKLYKKKNTVALKKGMNTISFAGIEKRNAGDIYIFFIDCFDFAFVNKDVIKLTENVSEQGEYSYPVISANNAEYILEATMVSAGLSNSLPDCSISVDGGSYIRFVKGDTVNVVSEYSEDGYLYGTYRLSDNISVNNKISLKIASDNCIVENLSLIPTISGLDEVFAKPDKVILLPGETADISVFANDEEGYALNLDFLRKNGGVTFKSSDRDVLAVNALGSVVALKPGIAHITVGASDGENVKTTDAEFNVYNEKYGFTILSAEKDADYVKVRLLSPFGTKETGHKMIIAEFSENEEILKNVTVHDVNNLNKGQIITCKMPASGNLFKAISWDSFNSMKSVYEVVAVREE